MDPLSVAGSIVALVATASRLFVATLDTARPGLRRTGASLTWAINCWSDEEVKAWKAAYIANCNSIAVASAIFASIGLSSLQLPDMNSTHWTARAFLITSMALGILSTVYATAQQAEVAMLIEPLDLRIYLSRGRNNWSALFRKVVQPVSVRNLSYSQAPRPLYVDNKQQDTKPVTDGRATGGTGMTSSDGSTPTRNTATLAKSDMYDLLPIQGSIAMEVRAQLPQELLYFAVLTYMVGFGLYLLSLWLRNVGDDGRNHQHIFIFFIVVVAVFVSRILFMSLIQVLDGARRDLDFDEQKPTTLRHRAMLDEWLTKLKELQTMNEQGKLGTGALPDKLLNEIVELAAEWRADSPESFTAAGIDIVTDIYLLSLLRLPEFVTSRLKRTRNHV